MKIYSMPESFLLDQNVPARWRLLGIINGFHINGRDFYASNDWISRQLNCSENTVSNATKELEALGEVTCVRTRNSRLIKRVTKPDPNQLGSAPQPTGVSDPNQLGTNSLSNADNILGVATAPQAKSFLPQGAVLVPVSESGEVLKSRAKADKVPEADIHEVFDLISKDCYKLVGIHKQQRKSAEALVLTKGMAQIRGAMHFYHDYKGEQMFPEIHSPFDLSEKWAKLLAAKKRLGV